MAKNPSNDAVQPTREASEPGPNKLADNAERGQLNVSRDGRYRERVDTSKTPEEERKRAPGEGAPRAITK